MLNPDTIQVTQELLALLSEIDEFKSAWRLLGTIAPERLNALRRVATIESIGSSTRIEGSKLTDREVDHNPVLQFDHAPAALPLRILEMPASLPPLEGLRHAHRAPIEIEIRPGERKVFARAHPGSDREHKQ